MRNQYRVLYNQDSTNLFYITRELITPEHVDAMVDEVAAGGADVLLVNPNAQRVNYPSRVWQTFWDGYTPGNRAFFGPVAETELANREHFVRQMKHLAGQGCDYLARCLARCREKGIAPGISVRMNDMHDAPAPGTHLFSRFYLEHPELHLNNGPASGWGATGLNYEHPEVRRHFLALIREVTHEYDCEVLELDFLRFQCYFPRGDFQRHGAIITDFMREVRSVLDASGRRIALLARVAATPAAAAELGFDLEAWAREGLVDGISAGAFLNTQWRVPIADFRALVGDDVALYACADYTADRRPGLALRSLPLDPALLRGFAAGYLAAGADGVELFNFFCSREDAWESTPSAGGGGGQGREPSFATLRELGALEHLRGLEKTYTMMSGWSVAETDGVVQVPVTLERGQVRAFRMLLAAQPHATATQPHATAAQHESDGARVELLLIYSGGDAVRAEELWLQINHTPVGPALSVAILPDPAKDIRQAQFTLPASALRDGDNELILRNEGDELTVISINVCVQI